MDHEIELAFRSLPPHHLPDIAPYRQDGIMRWPNGDVWIPEPQPSWTTGLFGRARLVDWRNHVLAASAQVRALARHAENLQRQLNNRGEPWRPTA
jgi:hypothetical protein